MAIMHWLGSQCIEPYDPVISEQYKNFGIGPTTAYVTMNIVNDDKDWRDWLGKVVSKVQDKPLMLIDDQTSADLEEIANERYPYLCRTFEREWLPVVLVLRDYYNNWASGRRRLNKKNLRQTWLQGFARTWAGYAREVEKPSLNLVPVLFNSWIQDAQYRQGISEQLGLTSHDRFLKFVPWPGSSFADKVPAQGNWNPPNAEDLLVRFKQVDLKQLRDATTEEVVELARKVFGMEPPWEQ